MVWVLIGGDVTPAKILNIPIKLIREWNLDNYVVANITFCTFDLLNTCGEVRNRFP